MLRIFETFAGIGAQSKALEILKNKGIIDYKIVATCEWDIYANISYNAIHFNNDTNVSKHKTIEEMKQFLKQFNHSKDSKQLMNPKQLDKLPNEIIIKLYSSYKNSNNLGSITQIEIEDIANLNVNVITYSFPCQDLSSAGKNEGMNKERNTRSSLIWEIDRILEGLKKINKLPKFLLLENVRNMISEKHKKDYILWLERLHNFYGYITETEILDASNFGIPQKRKRVFALSILNEKDFIDSWDEKTPIKNGYLKKFKNPYFSSTNEFECKQVKDLLKIDYNNYVYKQEAINAIPNWTQSRKEMFFNNPLLFVSYNQDLQNINKNEILNNNQKKNKLESTKQFSTFVRTITTKQDRNPNSGLISLYNTSLGIKNPIINQTKSNYRFLTPRETFLFMGFTEDDFNKVLENNFINKEKLYRQAGNSIVVNVLVYLFFNIYKMFLEEK